MTFLATSNELASERVNRARREIKELLKDFDNRLEFPFHRLVERYVTGNLCIHLHIEYSRQGDFSNGNACLIYCHPSTQSGSFQSRSGRGNHNSQLPMLVGDVHVVNAPKETIERIGTRIRLQTVNDCQRGNTGDSLYFSTVCGMFKFLANVGPNTLLSTEADRELNLRSEFLPSFDRGQLPNQMIEAGSQVMHDFTSKNREAEGNGVLPFSLKEIESKLLPRIGLLIAENWVYAGTHDWKLEGGKLGEEQTDLIIQVTDALVGPF